jgi:transcriptional regulator with XRE-family HTH domain
MNAPYVLPSPAFLGIEIRHARRSRKLSQKRLSETAHLDLATVANLEAGRGTVSSLLALLRAIGFHFSFQPADLGLGTCIVERRRLLRLSQEGLARVAGLSKPTIIQLERDKGHVVSFCAALVALGLPLSLKARESV